MPAEPTTTAKLCTVCGVDCAGKPRIKDQQGRYICKECFDKAKQTRQTQKNPPAPPGKASSPTPVAAVPAEGDNSFLLNLGSKESAGVSGTKPCPECGRAMPTNAVVCIGCGYNTSTGKRHTVKVIKSKQKAPKEKGSGRAMIIPPAAIGLVILLIYAGLAVGVYANKDFLLVAGLVSLVVGVGIGIWGAVAAFQESVGTGLLYIFLPFYSLYFILSKCENEALKFAWGAMVVGNIAMRVFTTLAMTP